VSVGLGGSSAERVADREHFFKRATLPGPGAAGSTRAVDIEEEIWGIGA